MPSRRQTRWIFRLLIISVIVSLAIVGGSMIQKYLRYRKARLTHYPAFGISIPDDYNIHGIDVSRYQQLIAWDQVQAMKVSQVSLGFAYIKATEGIANVDPQFRRNWRKAKEAGLYRGAYHFFIASKDGRAQAENFIDKVELESGDLPPVLDIEQLNGSSSFILKREAKKFLAILEEHYKVRPVIYTNVDFYNRYLGKEFDQYPLWVAHYYQPSEPRIKRGWVLWQHNDEGRVNGILSPVDFNVFNGDSVMFREFLVK